jgi:hypothetical protein
MLWLLRIAGLNALIRSETFAFHEALRADKTSHRIVKGSEDFFIIRATTSAIPKRPRTRHLAISFFSSRFTKVYLLYVFQ